MTRGRPRREGPPLLKINITLMGPEAKNVQTDLLAAKDEIEKLIGIPNLTWTQVLAYMAKHWITSHRRTGSDGER